MTETAATNQQNHSVEARQLHLPENLGGQNLLAIDTSLGSVVAVSRGAEVWQVASSDPMGHAEVIGELITRALAAASLKAAEITGVVMGTGPGPFTGLRVGMAAATAFAAGIDVPLLPLISHEAVAHEAGCFGESRPDGGGGTENTREIQVSQDARRKELFISDYRHNGQPGSLPELLAGPVVTKREEHTQRPGAELVAHEQVSCFALLQLALNRLASGVEFASPAPVYLRDPDVRPPAGVKSVIG
ncbi:MAG: tRNA (adenosine(37)-N6)-threonylcarbamoyltransferase complex dimerization subunit type 1 TsaB [Microbacteriaceae bacterium]|nr:tRNA (adenosine(37)-N6)-threonylcarbamoyltransferase complex dimerization subunit type 1 TsaB [Microbacteriaceae bacterium]